MYRTFDFSPESIKRNATNFQNEYKLWLFIVLHKNLWGHLNMINRFRIKICVFILDRWYNFHTDHLSIEFTLERKMNRISKMLNLILQITAERCHFDEYSDKIINHLGPTTVECHFTGTDIQPHNELRLFLIRTIFLSICFSATSLPTKIDPFYFDYIWAGNCRYAR